MYFAFNGQLAETLAALGKPGVDIDETDPVSTVSPIAGAWL